jgi:hypothetical protein
LFALALSFVGLLSVYGAIMASLMTSAFGI